MSEIIKKEDLVEKTSPSEVEEKKGEDKKETPAQDPLKAELERVQKKGEGRTQREKLIYTKKRIEEQLAGLDKEEGKDPTPEEEDDDAPVTIGMLKKLQQQGAVQTAIDMTEDIEDETERELTKYHLTNSIKSTGNPKEDIKLARAIVNSVKNQQILEEVGRKTDAKKHSGGSSAPVKPQKADIELTPQEMQFARPPFNMTKEQIVAARKK